MECDVGALAAGLRYNDTSQRSGEVFLNVEGWHSTTRRGRVQLKQEPQLFSGKLSQG